MKILSKLTAVAAGLVLASGVAFATVSPNSFYAGFNAQTGNQGVQGVLLAGGTVPSTVGSTCGSGTLTVKGGATAGKVVTTTCTSLVLVLTSAVGSQVYSSGNNDGLNATNNNSPPNGGICLGWDETNAATYHGVFAFVGSGATYTGYTCTITATITGGDTVSYLIVLY